MSTQSGASGPDENADAISILEDFTAQVEKMIAEASRLSQRAVALVSLVRFVERAKRFLVAQAEGELPFRLMAEILGFRDLARVEQARIDELLRQRIPTPANLDVLDIYKIHLGPLEQVAMASLGYVGSDREDGEEAA